MVDIEEKGASIKRKILFRIALLMIVTTIIIILNVIFNFRNYAIDTAKDKAAIVSGLVKDGLTSHMVNGTMDKRDLYLANIYRIKDVSRLWIVRGKKVVDQYGPARSSETARDAIDHKVLQSGQRYDQLDETSDSAVLRVTIPYMATETETPSCVSCHNVKSGDVLGVISMEFDIRKIREEGVRTVLHIALISIISLALVMWFAGRLLNPYLEIFESLKRAIQGAYYGDFNNRITTTLKDQAGDTANKFNSLMDKFNDTFGTIDNKLGVLVPHSKECSLDPLESAKETVTELANVYQFKKAIENDQGKIDIYSRIVFIIKERFGIKNFCIKEWCPKENDLKTVWSEGTGACVESPIAELCRAKRTDMVVNSDDFPQICPHYCGDAAHYICVPGTIGGTVGLILNMIAHNDEELQYVKTALPFIRGYLNEAAPVIETKMLMDALRESSLKDALTGLYNRRFLEEYLEKTLPLMKRNNKMMALLMIDIDYFKMVNDTFGHDVGDLVIKEVANVLRANVRESDLAVRYGGEEFLVILNNVTDENSVIAIAEKIREKVSLVSIRTNKETIQKTISIGVALYPIDTDAIWQCIKFADIALYSAKKTGRNRVIRYNLQMWEKTGDY